MGAMPVAQLPTWATLVRAPNPGPMTLDGTNTWILRAPGAPGCVIVDPGPDDEGHLAELAGVAPVELIIVTHRHPDHLDGVERLVDLLGGDVPVAAAAPELCRGTTPLIDGERREIAGLTILIMATPGHTSDSVCLVVNAEGVLTGDTILGRGTTIIAWPDGDLGAYLASLDRLGALDGVPVMPGHGPVLADCGQIARDYRAHREDRLNQVRAALAAGARTPAEVVVAVYPDLDPALVPAAEWTVRAALAHIGAP
jgi:glyoxylase-like metal-dependent hydrolase (beta-lactamase superfamily II)